MLSTLKYICFLGCLLTGVAYGQVHQVISAGGASGSTSQISGDYTIGETFVTTMSSQLSQLTQGFHQTDLISTSARQYIDNTVEVDVFPNPFQDRLNIRLDENIEIGMIRIFDTSGKMVHFATIKHLSGEVVTMDLNHIKPGMLILQLFDGQLSPIKSVPIIKL